MDPAHIFRQGLGSVPSRPNQPYTAHYQKPQRSNDDLSDDDGSGHRVAHTLTACCRCRQRKTRCDPSLPRCLPCERSGSICEYLDTAKGKKINRYYVIKLQDRVRALEAELAHYTDDENDYPKTTEDIVRPGGMIRLKASDETSRYLGPSSGIAMTRLLMEEAKRYTASNRISDLIPEVRARSQARMQSIQMTGPPNGRKKSYPMLSEGPADGLPSRATMDKLIELFIQKSQVFWPVLHEKNFERDMEAVYNGDEDPYKNFVLRMVIAIALQKFDSQYAGLADSYYLAAMQYAEAVIRPKDLRTLQCLVLIGHYSLLTPTRTPVYYVIGLATRICQQEGLTDEQTITTGYNLDEQTIDMRRRLAWIVAVMDFGLSYHMGRPSGFATGNDKVDVSIFSTVDDEHITANGISAGPTSPRKAFAAHFYQCRELQAEIRRNLYEQKRHQPNNDSYPWFDSIEKKMKSWLDAAPSHIQWGPSWCATFYHHTRVVLYRPSPQVPQPSARAATICFESSAFVINLAEKQMSSGFFSITWLLLLMLTSCLNALLWSTSYPEVRQAHSRQEVEDLVARALACLEKCAERWPGTRYTAQLYNVISKACLQSYDRAPDSQHPMFSFASPSSVAEPQSSPDSYVQTGPSQQLPYLNPPQFGFVFDSPPESMNAYTFDPNYPPPQPTFRSNSIFCNPATDANGRRFSYFPPEGSPEDNPAQSVMSHNQTTSPSVDHSRQIPTPPDSIPTGTMSAATPNTTLSPQNLPLQSSALSDASSAPRVVPMQDHISPPQSGQPTQVTPNFTTARPSVPQRPLPATTSAADWFSPPAPFISPYNFGPMSSNCFNDAMPNNFAEVPTGSLGGLQNMATGFDAHGQYGFMPGRQGSLTHSQQLELMNALETEGIGDIDAFLNAGNNMADVRWC
ncbi:Transcriptional activator protein acu-15 [Metarhizium brunneum]|uniref:Transcriptional activator protein acu-15 n=1 Tax=Metarhizium brunneum TaxID=500148 RepID=A0A7D5Z781_9HYPO